ncbi:hypothetical protein FAI40_01780 [Acetobacteraceae bacterium]|nr:hypothetical protein FAI40_01780 [Acetobacteraceae bacterium]
MSRKIKADLRKTQRDEKEKVEIAKIEKEYGKFEGGGGFRLWCAIEAQRQGEMQLQAILPIYTAYISRGSSAVTWTFTFAAALIGLAQLKENPLPWYFFLSTIPLLWAGISALFVLIPRDWFPAGDDPFKIMTKEFKIKEEGDEAFKTIISESELQTREHLARRSGLAFKDNARRLEYAKYWTISSYVALLIALFWCLVIVLYQHGFLSFFSRIFS